MRTNNDPPEPVRVAGTTRGEELALKKGKEPGRGEQEQYRSACDSTSINADDEHGATESLLASENRNELAENPALQEIQPDAEALLVNRAGAVREYIVAPIDVWFELAGLIRMHWRRVVPQRISLAGDRKVFHASRKANKKANTAIRQLAGGCLCRNLISKSTESNRWRAV